MNVSGTARIKYPSLVVSIGLLLGLPSLVAGFPYPTHDGRIHD